MKKIIAILAVVLCVAVASACSLLRRQEPPEPQPSEYIVIFMSNGVEVTRKTVKAGEPVSEPTVTRDDYELVCWKYGDEIWDFSNAVTSDMTLYAQWKAVEPVEVQYTIILDAGEGAFADGSKTKTVTSDETNVEVPSREHYEFMGFYDELPNGNRYFDRFGSVYKKVTSDITLHAAYIGETIDVRYRWGNTSLFSASATYGNSFKFSTPSASKFLGYEFVEWQIGDTKYAAGEELEKFELVPQDGETYIIVTAVVKPRSYTLKLDAGEGAVKDNQTDVIIEYGDEDVNIPVCERVGYSFAGYTLNFWDGYRWGTLEFTDEDGKMTAAFTSGLFSRYPNEFDEYLLRTGEKAPYLLAQYEINKYTFTIEKNFVSAGIVEAVYGEDKILSSMSKAIDYQTEVTLSATTDIGYKFAGYKVGDETTTETSATFTVPAADITVTAMWTACTEHTLENCVCTLCGKEVHDYKTCNHTNAQNKRVVYFGSYPQTRIATRVTNKTPDVTDDTLYKALVEEAGTPPSSADRGDWTDYGYYYGGKKQAYSFYKDFMFENEKYRAVYDILSRDLPCRPVVGTSNLLSFFRFEPIAWSVLGSLDRMATDDKSKMLLFSEKVLDSQPFDICTQQTGCTSGYTSTARANWGQSAMNSFLNGYTGGKISSGTSFIDWAFDSEQKNKLLVVDTSTTPTNSGLYGFENYYNSSIFSAGSSQIFLLDFNQLSDSAYGFKDFDQEDPARVRVATGYAAWQDGRYGGVDAGELCLYWTRSPGCAYTKSDKDLLLGQVKEIGTTGRIACNPNQNNTQKHAAGAKAENLYGVCPAICLDLSDAQ